MESQLIPMPIKKMMIVRLSIFKPAGILKVKSYFRKEMYVEIPMINMKKGNTRSVGVKPIHSACLRGAYVCCQEPGVFTKIIPAMVMPRITSSANRRLLLVTFMTVTFLMC